MAGSRFGIPAPRESRAISGRKSFGHSCRHNLLMHCDENQVVLCGSTGPLEQTIVDGRPHEALLRHKEGQGIPVRVRSVPVRDEFGAIAGAAECFEERSFRAVERRCPHLPAGASLDEVTQIPDRHAALAGFSAALQEFGASQVPFGVLSIAVDNLDHLRHVNGCPAANAVLYVVAQTLTGGTRPDDLVGCWREDRSAALVAGSRFTRKLYLDSLKMLFDLFNRSRRKV